VQSVQLSLHGLHGSVLISHPAFDGHLEQFGYSEHAVPHGVSIHGSFGGVTVHPTFDGHLEQFGYPAHVDKHGVSIHGSFGGVTVHPGLDWHLEQFGYREHVIPHGVSIHGSGGGVTLHIANDGHLVQSVHVDPHGFALHGLHEANVGHNAQLVHEGSHGLFTHRHDSADCFQHPLTQSQYLLSVRHCLAAPAVHEPLLHTGAGVPTVTIEQTKPIDITPNPVKIL
jgi:hypothetical protein